MSLSDIQSKVHVAKEKVNEFGGYKFRTAEGILAAAKAALPDGWSIVCSDQIKEVGGQIFVSAIACILDEKMEKVRSSSGHAMHPLQKKGMDPSQITGAASSYARKHALAGLLALDDGSVDPDATNNKDGAAGSLSPNVQAWEDAIYDELPDDPSPQTVATAFADRIEQEAAGYKQVKWLDAYMKKHAEHMAFIEQHNPDRYAKTREVAVTRRTEIQGKAA